MATRGLENAKSGGTIAPPFTRKITQQHPEGAAFLHHHYPEALLSAPH
jgi:hypothetical protein